MSTDTDTPTEPTSSEPTPSEPTPSEPTPSAPTPAESTDVPATMRAIVHDRYGPPSVLEQRTVPVPDTGPGRVLVRVRAAGVNVFDWHMMTGTPYLTRMQGGWRRPKRTTPGVDLAGTVVAVGPDVTRFRPGDEVFGGGVGTFAEYVSVEEDDIAVRPESLGVEAAGSVAVAAFTALQAVRDHGGVVAGERVLVNGATGGVGLFAVQLAKLLGAEVTAVCSTRNVELASSLGADDVVDYTQDDFVERGPFDVVIDIVGNRSIRECRRSLTERGRYVMIGGPKDNRVLGPIGRVIGMMASFAVSRRSGSFFIAQQNAADLEYLRSLLADGSIRSVVDRTYPLTLAAAAVDHVAEGHTRGKVVVVP